MGPQHVLRHEARCAAPDPRGVRCESVLSAAVAGEGYDDTMPILSRTGRFDPKALDVLATSFVDTKALPSKPDMSKLLTEAFLPK